jgi:hypothetical protein
VSRGRNYTAGERAVCTLGVLSGKSLMEINEQLRVDSERSNGTLRLLPESSYKMLKQRYAPHLALGLGMGPLGWDEVWKHITEPKPVGEL